MNQNTEHPAASLVWASVVLSLIKLQLNVDPERQTMEDCWENNVSKIQMHIDLCLNTKTTWFIIKQSLHAQIYSQLAHDIYEAMGSMCSLPQQRRKRNTVLDKHINWGCICWNTCTNTLHLFHRGKQTQFIHFSAETRLQCRAKNWLKLKVWRRQNKESGNHPHPLFGTPEIGQRLISSYQRSPGKPERLEGKEEREEVEGWWRRWGDSVGP